MATIVIVDDNIDSCRFLERLLNFEGHVAVCMPGADGVMEMLRMMKPDLILLDVMLPGVNGIELLKTIRSDPSLSYLPVIMVSGVLDLEVQTEAFNLGAADYIVKDLNWESSLARLQQYLPKN